MSETETLTRDDDLAAEARAVLEVGGCRAIRIEGAGDSWHVWGGYHPGQFFVTAFSAKNPDTPNDPVYLAHQVLATLERNEGRSPYLPPLEAPPLADPASVLVETAPGVLELAPEPQDTPQDETHGETGAESHGEVVGAGEELGTAPERGVDAIFVTETGETSAYDFPVASAAYDAEFYEPDLTPLDDADLADLPQIEGADLGAEIPAEEAEADPSGVAYFGDNIQTIRLAKMGRLSQIARELKATLQDGWTLAEFASLQNLIVRIDRQEAPDDPEARSRFMAISERSQAMARVDVHREAREVELELADREGVEAFDPEADWPLF